jgi:hypothetical protein
LIHRTDGLRWQTIPTLPGPNFAPGANAPPHWAADRGLALLYKPNTVQLFSFDPATQATKLISTDVSCLNDESFWSPNGQQHPEDERDPSYYQRPSRGINQPRRGQ